MGLAIAGNPANAEILCSSTLEQSLRRGRFWDEPVSAGVMFRFVDLVIDRPGWMKVGQSGINISCLQHGAFASSYFRRGDADARACSLRIFSLDQNRYQLVSFPRPTRYRLIQLALDPDRLDAIATDLDADPDILSRTMRQSCHVDRRFRVSNRPMPIPVGRVMGDLLDSGRSDYLRRLKLYGKAVEILAHTLEAICLSDADRSGGTPDPVAQVADILRTDFRAPPAMARLARQAGLSEDTLTRAFRARHGMTPSAFLGMARMVEAGHLLEDGDVPIAEIGRRVGFSNPAAFSRAFRRHFGHAPSERRSLRDALPDAAGAP